MLLDEVADYLVAQGLGIVGTDIFKGMQPSEPDDCLTILEAGGGPPDLHWAGDYPGFQILTRAVDYETARTQAEAAFGKLHGLSEAVLGARRYLLIRAVQSPAYIGRDENGRPEISTNYQCIVENPTELR